MHSSAPKTQRREFAMKWMVVKLCPPTALDTDFSSNENRMVSEPFDSEEEAQEWAENCRRETNNDRIYMVIELDP